MSVDENNKLKVEDSVALEDEKKSKECLKDSVKFEDFLPQSTESKVEEEKGEIEPKTVPIEEYERLKRELCDTTDLLKRVAADFENYKKRVAKEKEDLLKFANESILRDMLETADNLELTLLHSRQLPSVNEDLVKGFEITVRGFIEFLKRYGVVPLDIIANETRFDPNFHEAIGVQESDTVPAGTIIKVERKGYMLRDRLLRPALVVVSKGRQESNKDEPKPNHVCIAEPEPESKDE